MRRDYESGIGRYVQSDPIGLDGGVLTYVYAASRPMSNIDSMGLKWVVGGTLGRGSNRAAIVCKNGRVTFEFQSYQDYGCSEISSAAIAHENSHIGDIDPSVCDCAPDGSFVSNTDHQERLNSERKAFNVELQSLRRARSRSASQTCKKMIDSRIKDIENRLIPCVDSGAYPSCQGP